MHQGAVEVGQPGKVKLLQRLGGSELRPAQPGAELLLVAPCHLVTDEQSKELGTVRDFRGAMVGRADKGLLITTGTFTKDARTEAQRDGAPPIDLIDGEALVEKLKELKIGVQVKARVVEEVVIDEVYFRNL